MNVTLYESALWMKGISAIAGEQKEFKRMELSEFDEDSTPDVLLAFLKDDELQEITICSTNIGFVRTYQKRFRKC